MSQKKLQTNEQQDVIEMLNAFQQQVLEKKPSITQMYEEVRMMRFKIRPLFGDISMLDFQNSHFIETLWSLGKLDEFYQDNVDTLPKQQQSLFYSLFNTMYHTYHKSLNDVNLKQENIRSQPYGFELEIYKEKRKKKLN